MRPRPDSLWASVAEILRQRTALQTAPAGYRRAAILLPLYETAAGPHVVLTQRTEGVPTHKGQISFPGGGFQEADGDLQVTALREAQEEIALRPEDVTILGALDDTLAATSRYVVRPFVGSVPHPYPYRPDPLEIAGVIHLPVLPLLCGATFREETWERDGRRFPVYFYEHAGQTVWGLTARILKQFLEVVGLPLREQGLLDPARWASAGGA